MIGLALLCGHMVGDYIVQNDWMASNKTNPKPKGVRPCTVWDDGVGGGGMTPGTPEDRAEWDATYRKWVVGELACLTHCLCYTLAVWAFSFWWMPLWGLVAVFALHYPIDRWRLAGRWMRNVSGQKAFASGPMAPWSIIIVDNTMHLIVLVVIGLIAIGGR